MNNTIENNNNTNIWETLSILVQNLLAHVNITFDGATRSLHIDIVPTDNRVVDVDHKEVTQKETQPERITDKKEAREEKEPDPGEPTEDSAQAAAEPQGGKNGL